MKLAACQAMVAQEVDLESTAAVQAAIAVEEL